VVAFVLRDVKKYATKKGEKHNKKRKKIFSFGSSFGGCSVV